MTALETGLAAGVALGFLAITAPFWALWWWS